MNDDELLLLNAQGFIPGPLESEEDFLKRVEQVRVATGQIPSAHWDWVRMHLKEIFDFAPRCLPAFYSNKNLAIWQGAATWIEEGRVEVQLRESFRKGSFFGYSRDEILAHESVHAARSAFEEPKAEEFFAFLVSEKWWRRIFGPIVQRPWEVWVFALSMVAALFSPWGSFLAALWIGAGFWRLIRCHRRMRLAGKNLMAAVKDAKKVRAILVRLTDLEIEGFAKGQNLFEFAERSYCLRWRLIRLAYLGEKDGRKDCS